ncbi:peptidase S49 [Kordiimonas sediminis]|uniref:Peptidase S49 n=1 Tax=Kordiimonas sediminis TaxID=1735581 RepID=A0A919ATB5_9PROT|nr:S49 family peptidase [Kordiimonas sediminis]GHF23271.1 peptidase S49 [Kordiimonas sediminis]
MANPVSKFLSSARTALFGKPKPVVAVIRLYGVIASGGRFQKGLNMADLAPTLDEAFETKGLSAVALLINSPGGSPVQSAMITSRIRALAAEKDVPVVAFAEDVAASGGYMLALAGDEIFAHEASIIGSIGVISAGFGFKDAIEKIGVERRVYSAGDKKAMLDPFKEENEEDVERLKSLHGEIHEYFKGMVRDRRGKRLKGLRGKIFSGDVFSGVEAHKLGLTDGIGDIRSKMQERFGKKVKLKVVGEKKSRLSGLLGLSKTQSLTSTASPIDGLGKELLSAVEERFIWNRFGL